MFNFLKPLSIYGHKIKYHPSRCLRVRYRKSRCNICELQCPHKAIHLEKTVEIDQKDCTECLLCCSACPTEALSYKQAPVFLKTLQKDANSDLVIGCERNSTLDPDITLPCLGILSEYHFAALFFVTKRRVNILLTHCKGCINERIKKIVQERYGQLLIRFGSQVEKKIRIITSLENDTFCDPRLERRAFFKAIKELAFFQAALKKKSTENERQGYSHKFVPGKINLLHVSLLAASPDELNILRAHYTFSPTIVDSLCDRCWVCVGMCPVGVLKRYSDGKTKKIRVTPDSCCGCGLCEDYCRKGAITVQ